MVTITAPSVVQSRVGVLNKACAILAVLEEKPACLDTVISETGLKRLTVHRLVFAMQELGLVEADPRGQFIAGPRLIRLARAAHQAIADLELRQELSALRATTGVRSVRLEQRRGDQRICIAEDQRLKSAASDGNRPRAVAMGEDPVSRVFLARRGLSQGHAAWTDSVACSGTRCRGWVQGVADGCLVLAVAVGDGDGDLSAVLSLSSPLQRTRRQASYGREVVTAAMEAAARISGRLRTKEATGLVKGLEDRVRGVGPQSVE
ncbi:helix-turn-helix domain-containing protein [Streptomyces melanosporofaciens]|uniref:DNA-binding transcriptional regulator, IclR family n=1 Tax=Streptomyces melanosporofaciens TaxID=67327 RepID=A0A1H4KTN4_STRMJ|nr:helix-turn-helix domain-containing protein [Streptomyces melanosporofaciens]SEB61272.1 DNA-binding transcriptional regulator, IclR family [Streptomyces melanosporofaciens]